MTRWMKGPPRAEGMYWYWVLGSSRVLQQVVFLARRNFRDTLCIDQGEGPSDAKGPLRLWARCIKKPPLPSENEMAALDARRKAL